MNIKRTILLCLSECLIVSTAAADQVVLKNGDRITGAIVKKDGGDLVVKSDLFGVVTMPWDKVESAKAEKPVNVVLSDGKTIQGTIASVGGKLEIVAAGSKVDAAASDVKTIRDDAEQKAYERMLRPGWGDLWTGTASIGFAGTAGNAKTLTFTTGVNAARVTNTDKTTLYFNTIKASALVNGKSADTAQAVRGGVGYNHNVTRRLFVNVFNDYEYDRFQNLDLRFVLGGGFGFHAIKNDRSSFDILGGADFNRSSFNTPLTTKSGELYWGDEYNFKLNGATSLVQTFRMFNDITNTGTYRMNGDLGLTTKLTKHLTWNLTLSDRYLNHPAPGRKTNDFLYTTGLGVTFAK